MQSEATLKQAVEQQLDLILKIEQERKLLKRQNKMLKEQHQKMLNIVKKYNQNAVQKQDVSVQTDPQQKEQVPESVKIQTRQVHVQVDIDVGSQLNTSKLSIAQELLKNRSNAPSQSICQKWQQNKMSLANREEPKKKTSAGNTNSQQVGTQIVKMTKEIASLKRQLVQSDKQYKNRQKDLKEARRCLQVKSQALEKSRKDFNELSKVFNTDKYKSVKVMGEELTQVKARLSVLEEESRYAGDLRRTLEDITLEYQAYREEKQHKIERLLSQLKEKDAKFQDLSRQSFRMQNSYV